MVKKIIKIFILIIFKMLLEVKIVVIIIAATTGLFIYMDFNYY